MTSSVRPGVLGIDGAPDPRPSGLPLLGAPAPGPVDGTGIDDEMRRNLAYGRAPTLLPYTRQGEYVRGRSPRELPTVVVENDVLTATFLPRYGGRLWSLVHRRSGRELLHRNPILQPANLALRDAWLAGGVEWNLGTTGHWGLTCEPLHAARMITDDGTPVLRMFEFERLRRLVLCIDAWLPPGSPVLYVRVSIDNPSPDPVPVYWWSNIAVPQTPGVRVIGPADHAFHFDYVRDLRRVPFPDSGGVDRSYAARAQASADYFLDIPPGQRPWIAALDRDGIGLVHTSTPELRGRKLFCWGTGTGGTHWQEWLSGPDSAYLEIQGGLARTQLEHLPLPGGETCSWVEAYGMIRAEPAAAHGPWDQAQETVGHALDGLVGPDDLERARVGDRRFEEMLGSGSGWGALEIAAGTFQPAPALPFGVPGAEQRPWLELLRSGRLPVCDPPAEAVTGVVWRSLLEAAPADWHSLYHLGLVRLADGSVDGARDAFERSLADRETPWVLRGLAALAGPIGERADLLVRAQALLPEHVELAVEALDALRAAGRPQRALELVASLGGQARMDGRVRLAEAAAAHEAGDDDRARRLLDDGITVPNLREGDVSLDRLWLAVHPGRPVPWEYDFRMSGG